MWFSPSLPVMPPVCQHYLVEFALSGENLEAGLCPEVGLPN
jgi:hypothetical protein